MFEKNKKGRVSRKTKSKGTYTGAPMDLVLGIDFELFDDPNNNWVCVKLLKGKYEGVRYKYNSIGVKEDPTKTNADHLMMTMDYEVIDYNNLSKKIEKEEEFNNTVFNVVYALIVMQNGTLDNASADVVEEDSDE